jgi:hypothetical protein
METISKTPSELTEFVLRPSLGTSGRHIRVRSNFFEITNLPDMEIIHYDITITPDVPPTLNRKIFAEFENLNLSGALGNVRPVFDGKFKFKFCAIINTCMFLTSHFNRTQEYIYFSTAAH